MKYLLFLILICNYYISTGQSPISTIEGRYHYYSFSDQENWWVNGSRGWHHYDGKNRTDYLVSEESSGLKGTFVQSELIEDNRNRLWTTTYEYLCYYDHKIDSFNCFQPIFNGDTLNTGLKAIHYFEKDNELLFAFKTKLLLINLDDLAIRLFTDQFTKEVAVATYIEGENELLTGPWVFAPLFEKWQVKKEGIQHQLIAFDDCLSEIQNITVSDFEKIADDYWLASPVGLVKLNEKKPCSSEIFKFQKGDLTISKVTKYGDVLLLTTGKHGVLLFDIKKELFIGSLSEDNSNVTLNSNSVFEIFEKNKSLVLGLIDAPMQEISKSALEAEILLKGTEETNSKVIYVANNSSYFALSDRINYIKIYDDKFNLIHTEDKSKMKLLASIILIKDTLIYATSDEIVSLNLNNKKDRFQYKYPKSLNELHYHNGKIFATGAGFVDEIFLHENRKEDVPFYINDVHSFIKQKSYSISTNTTTLRVNNEAYAKDYHFERFIDDLQNGRNENEVIALSNNNLHVIDLTKEIKKEVAFDNIEVKGSYVKNEKEILLWDSKGIYLVNEANEVRKIIHAKKPYKVVYFAGHYIYTSGSEIHMVHESEIIAPEDESTLSIYHANYPYEMKNDVACFKYQYYNTPLKLEFGLNSILANENGFYSFENSSGETDFFSIQDPLPIAYFQEGKTNLRIQGYNQDGTKANNLSIQVKVIGPFWRQWWFYAILGLLATLGGYLYFRMRVKRIEEQYATKEELNQLERSALQAQMNPHFIFNCLNSIQGFIMKNDKENAMEYLGGFAQLIRGNLNASLSKTLSLQNEIGILNNYIKLELLRLNNSFEYEIEVADDILTQDVFIPPMLIQPFVENAIIHGMHKKMEGGKINIAFTKDKDILKVSISDNGDGTQAPRRPKHKSVGVTITKKRLAHINATQNEDFNMHIDKEGQGTRVNLRIRYSGPEEGSLK